MQVSYIHNRPHHAECRVTNEIKRFEVVNTLNITTWRQFVDQHPQGNIFHSPEMFQVFAQAKGYKPSLWAVIDDNKSVLALALPVQVTLMGGRILRQLTTRSILYGSVLCNPSPHGKQALETVLNAYQYEIKDKALFSELRNLSDLSNLHPVLERNGFIYEEHLNYLIDIGHPVEEVLQNIGKRTRKAIRKGIRNGLIQVTEVKDRSELENWYETLKKSYRYAQVPVADRSLFEATFDVLHPKGMAKFLLAKANGATAACSLELLYRDTIYGWYGGVDRNYSDYYPNEMLMWHILEWGAKNGYKVYDFGGAGSPDEDYGVRDFKAKFNGELVCFGRYTYVHSPSLLRLSELGYKLYRQLFFGPV